MITAKKIFLTRTLLVLGAVSFLTDISSEMIYPLLPGFLVLQGLISAQTLGLIEGIAESASSLLKVFSGWWTDYFQKRRPLIVVGYTVSSLFRPLVAVAPSGFWVGLFRFFDRVGKGIRTSPRDALISDSTPSEYRGAAFGFHRAMDHAGAVVGPLVAFALIGFLGLSTKEVFLWAFVPGFISVAFLFFLLPVEKPLAPSTTALPNSSESQTPSAQKQGLFSSWGLFSDDLKKSLGLFFVFSLCLSSDGFLLLQLESSGVPTKYIPILWSALHIVKSLSSYYLGAISDRWGVGQSLVSGWILYAVIYAGFALNPPLVVQVFLFLTYGLYFGLTEGPERAWISRLAQASIQGQAFGLFHFLSGIALLPASFLFGILWTQLGASWAFATTAVLAAGCALLAKGSRLFQSSSRSSQ